ncbi:MAG: hypothetical protein RL095_492 [Verrucomicrobiota bacterium]|jgi:multiple sugar transport system substrate-binding protein
MSDVKQLRGITWNHSRGLCSVQATAQRFHEMNPGVEILWEKRSLQAFADESIASLSARFDLLVVDHPSSGEAAAHGLFLPLDEHLPAAFLVDQAANSVGGSHESYQFGGHQWALAIDAATPVAGWREDLLAKHKVQVPQTWEQLLDLARGGLVEFCGWPIDCLMYFYAFCVNEGEDPFQSRERVVSDDVGRRALEAIKGLADLCDPAGFSRNPIRSWELLSRADSRAAYCPFAYGYSNYARAGYGERRLRFGGLVSRKGHRLTSTLGGTGLAISAKTRHPEVAAAYAQFSASAAVQTGLFTAAGGQPGHRAAWLDAENNRVTSHYFTDTLPTLDAAYHRPRFDGYIDFQIQAPVPVLAFLQGRSSAAEALAELNRIYQQFPGR